VIFIIVFNFHLYFSSLNAGRPKARELLDLYVTLETDASLSLSLSSHWTRCTCYLNVSFVPQRKRTGAKLPNFSPLMIIKGIESNKIQPCTTWARCWDNERNRPKVGAVLQRVNWRNNHIHERMRYCETRGMKWDSLCDAPLNNKAHHTSPEDSCLKFLMENVPFFFFVEQTHTGNAAAASVYSTSL